MTTRTITRGQVADALLAVLPQLAFELPTDIRQGLESAFERETNPRAREALRLLVENACVARDDRVAICQDTGSVWVCLEIGPDVSISGDVLADVDAAVAQVYCANSLRKSLVHDALFDRSNTGDNTPAFCEVRPSAKPGARLQVMCKGGGSDNASRVVMLVPGAGKQGVIDAVLACVREKAANACPPLIIGVGVGSTFDKVAGLAKHALMRPIDAPSSDPHVAAFENELLETVNATGIGAAALGGDTTALAVRVETAPCHIAALPLAVNMGCSAMRRGTYEL
jgi:tartrate/fumarate subfamily iron-sulfur-dependent hydro-lyase alpha chain